MESNVEKRESFLGQFIPDEMRDQDGDGKADGMSNNMRTSIIIGIAAIAGLYLFKTIQSGGVDVTNVDGITYKRSAFAWVDIVLAVVVSFYIIRSARTLFRL